MGRYWGPTKILARGGQVATVVLPIQILGLRSPNVIFQLYTLKNSVWIKTVISVDICIIGHIFLTLFYQVVMFSNSENNSDGVYYFCENEFCIPFRRDKKDCMRKSKYITGII